MSFTESVGYVVQENANGLLSAHQTWERVHLSEVATILNGFPFESARFQRNAGTPLVRIRDVREDQSETYFDGDFDPGYLIEHADLLIGMDGDFPCALWRGGRALLNQRVCRVTPDERFYSKRLLANVLPGYLEAINRRTSSITVKHLSSYTVGEIPLPLPPRDEQERLADAVDSYLSRLDDAVASLERVQRNLKRYRAAVLQAAVEGRLVPTEAELARAEGRSFEPASELLARILTERRRRWEESELAKLRAKGKEPKNDAWKRRYFEPALPEATELPSLPEGWCWASVEQLETGDRSCAYGVLVPGPDVEDGIPLVRVGDIDNGHVEATGLKRIHRRVSDQFQRTYLRGGELLLTLVGTIGRTAVVPKVLRGANVARAVGVLPLSELVSASWAELFFRSPKQRTRMVGAAHEVARKTLNLEDVRRAMIALPPRHEQERVVDQVADVESVCDAVERTVRLALTRCHRLRQSILKWAFEGKLVDQDPSDEPAGVLLERIRAERARAPARPARGRRAKAPRGSALPGAGG